LALVKKESACCTVAGFLRIVVDEEDGEAALLAQTINQLKHFGSPGGVKSGERFVQQ
jgi:hypothetical protein